MKLHHRFTAFLFVALLAGCAQLGIEAPQTFNERVAVAISTVNEVRVQATTALKQGIIKADDAENVQKQADNARQAIDIARQVHGTNPQAADAKLQAARTVLTALQQYLLTHSK